MSKKLNRIAAIILSISLIFQQAGFAQIAAQLNMAGYFKGMQQSFPTDKFCPAHLRYFSYNNLNNEFKVLLDKGTQPNNSSNSITQPAQELLHYFLIGVTLPDDKFWVNLRPDAADNIIDEDLAKTDIGKIFLETDLELKKDTARLTSPETPEGKAYWDKLYKKAEELFGSDQITIPTLTRPWIVPNEVIIRQSADSAYIYKATMKVLLEEDYLAANSTNPALATNATYAFTDPRLKELNKYSTELIKESILPKLKKMVNTSRKYANLRQVFYCLVLARWFKSNFTGKPGTYSYLINKSDLRGLTSTQGWSKTTYFKDYQKSFKDGEYNLKVPVTGISGQVIRSYFSGGIRMSSSAININNGFLSKQPFSLGVLAKTGSLLSGSAGSPLGVTLQPVFASSAVGAQEGGASSPITIDEYKIYNQGKGVPNIARIIAEAREGSTKYFNQKEMDYFAKYFIEPLVVEFFDDLGRAPTIEEANEIFFAVPMKLTKNERTEYIKRVTKEYFDGKIKNISKMFSPSQSTRLSTKFYTDMSNWLDDLTSTRSNLSIRQQVTAIRAFIKVVRLYERREIDSLRIYPEQIIPLVGVEMEKDQENTTGGEGFKKASEVLFGGPFPTLLKILADEEKDFTGLDPRLGLFRTSSHFKDGLSQIANSLQTYLSNTAQNASSAIDAKQAAEAFLIDNLDGVLTRDDFTHLMKAAKCTAEALADAIVAAAFENNILLNKNGEGFVITEIKNNESVPVVNDWRALDQKQNNDKVRQEEKMRALASQIVEAFSNTQKAVSKGSVFSSNAQPVLRFLNQRKGQVVPAEDLKKFLQASNLSPEVFADAVIEVVSVPQSRIVVEVRTAGLKISEGARGLAGAIVTKGQILRLLDPKAAQKANGQALSQGEADDGASSAVAADDVKKVFSQIDRVRTMARRVRFDTLAAITGLSIEHVRQAINGIVDDAKLRSKFEMRIDDAGVNFPQSNYDMLSEEMRRLVYLGTNKLPTPVKVDSILRITGLTPDGLFAAIDDLNKEGAFSRGGDLGIKDGVLMNPVSGDLISGIELSGRLLEVIKQTVERAVQMNQREIRVIFGPWQGDFSVKFSPERIRSYVLAEISERSRTSSSQYQINNDLNPDRNFGTTIFIRKLSSSAIVNPSKTFGVSSAVASKDTGGIDLRSININVQPMGSFVKLNLQLPQADRNMDIDDELLQINKMLEAGIRPNSERFAMVASSCIQRKELSQHAQDLALAVVKTYKLDEASGVESDEDLMKVSLIIDSI